MTIGIILLTVAFLVVFMGGLIFLKYLKICGPNEVFVISGRQRMLGSRRVGYRLVQGGRAFVIPFLERVNRLDLTNMVIDVQVRGSYSKGGIPLNVDAVANLKVASSEPTIGNAIERFLGKHRSELVHVAKDTLEGNLRGVLATLTPEEVNNDRVKFAQSLLHEADVDLKRLGLVLDTLKIQNVSDDKGYLDSLGRKSTAELQKFSRIAETDNQALAAERAAENLETKEVARIVAEMEMLRAEAEKRVVDAQTRQQAMVAEQQGEVVALVARAQAELEVQTARIEQVRLQLEADRIRPAEAQRTQMVEGARANAAPIVEQGNANARALERVAGAWKEAGVDARRVFLAQRLNSLIAAMLNTVQKQPIDRITVIDSAISGGGGNPATNALLLSEQLKETLGVDLPGVIRGLSPTTELPSSPAPRPSGPPPMPNRPASSGGDRG